MSKKNPPSDPDWMDHDGPTADGPLNDPNDPNARPGLRAAAAPREAPATARVKCIVTLHPWTDQKWLELDEEADTTPEIAQGLIDKGFCVAVDPPPP
jgi:hypothetical protein